jgi:streptogramin lyase
VAVDGSGNVYVADTTNELIRKITSAGVVTTLAGTALAVGSANGTGAAARFNSPTEVAVDTAGNVYVADTNNHLIRKITPAGVVTTLAGTAGATGSADGTGTAATFKFPYGVAVDGSGNVYVADTINHLIRKITSAGVVTTLAGTAGATGSTNGTGAAARFDSPSGVAVDGSGNVYVADATNDLIRKITSAGVVTTLAGTAGAAGQTNGTGAAARFDSPSGVAVDGSGNVYVADTINHLIRKITPAGVVTTLAGTAGATGSADGTGTAATFKFPYGVAVDGSGNVYVADTNNDLIRKIN